MPLISKYLFVATMDVEPDKEVLFNEVYDTEHVPNLLNVPGVRAAARIKGEPFALCIGGEQRWIAHENPRYTAVYEIDGPEVLISRAWAVAGEAASNGLMLDKQVQMPANNLSLIFRRQSAPQDDQRST